METHICLLTGRGIKKAPPSNLKRDFFAATILCFLVLQTFQFWLNCATSFFRPSFVGRSLGGYGLNIFWLLALFICPEISQVLAFCELWFQEVGAVCCHQLQDHSVLVEECSSEQRGPSAPQTFGCFLSWLKMSENVVWMP